MNTTQRWGKIPPSETTDSKTSSKIDDTTIEEGFTKQGEIDNQKSENQLFFLKWVRWTMPVLFVFLIGIFCISLLIWATHYLTPWCWLDTKQLDKIESVIFSGSIGVVVGTSFRNYLEK
ncbi:MAG: hypothetical protein OXC57_14700 [Rhodobacteraceae bacterium]|nr:hypothetical protein [Paracoccaceae bacterium]